MKNETANRMDSEMKEMKIALFPGDGIGPEVIQSAVTVLNKIAEKYRYQIEYQTLDIGGISIDRHGVPLTDEALITAQTCDAVLLGAVGGPKWENTEGKIRPEQGLLKLRKSLDAYANLRPVKTYPRLFEKAPLKTDLLEQVDILFVRELTGGIYFGQKERKIINGVESAIDVLEYKDYEIERVVSLAFNLAEKRKQQVTSVDKANVLESSRLWRRITDKIGQSRPSISLNHLLVDTASMKLITHPRNFDVVVTENMFGDILTDEISVLAGSMGLIPSASLGVSNKGIYEPIHGSAPDIAGKSCANPAGSILSAAMMLRYTFGEEQAAAEIEKSVEMWIEKDDLTPDLGGCATTADVTRSVVQFL